MDINKKDLTEQDICTKYIVPALETAGWNIKNQVREQVTFTKGRIIVKGKTISRGEPKRADFILYCKPNQPIAIIEAKDNNKSLGGGMQQALDYADILDIPFVFSSNGDGFLEHDKTITNGQVEKELSLESFPSPEELYNRYLVSKGLTPEQEKVVAQDYYYDSQGKTPRYYQQIAINKTVEAVSKGQDRVLLVMATGTGKTYVAFQTIWKLWKSGLKKRILFLADRNILVDQAKTNDFKYFGDKMTKITNRQIDKSYEIYLSLYQAVTGTEDIKNIYRQFSPDFFDLIVIDECHRGSAPADSSWHEILQYFTSATHIGLTATPKETKEVSNIEYFGDPIYTYSLKQGIEDGFLAPYKVVRITLDKDQGWRPEVGTVDTEGNEVPDEIYSGADFDRKVILDERTKLVAKKISDFLKETNRFDKTIVFCIDIDHAERMRQCLVNENSDLVNSHPKYIMRITGDNDIGKAELDNFIDPESRFPVIVTTSKLLTTGVDAQTCKLIVLDSNIKSMTEFKQIIGRGTRVREDYDKFFFTIMDFRDVTDKFADKDFDGPPIQIYEPQGNDPVAPPEITDEETNEDTNGIESDPIETVVSKGGVLVDFPPKQKKITIRGVEVKVINERVQYIDGNGKLITESLKDFTRKNVRQEYASLNDFIQKWNSTDSKKAIIAELEQQGVLFDELNHEIGKDLDPLDLICHIVFDKPPLTRKERAENVKKRNYFTKYGDKAKAVLNALLDKYADEGIQHIEDLYILRVDPFRQFGTPSEIIDDYFGGKDKYMEALTDLEKYLYMQPTGGINNVTVSHN